MKLRVMPVFFKTEKPTVEATLAWVRDLMPLHAELTGEAELDTWEDLQALREHAPDADVLLELSEHIRLVPIRLLLGLADFGLPMLLFGGEFCPGVRRIEAAGCWRAEGHMALLPLTREEIREQIFLMAAKHRIEQTQALLVGSRFGSPFVLTSPTDFGAALRSLGVRIRSCEPARLLESYEGAEEAQVAQLAAKWSQEAKDMLEPGDEDLSKSARFYLAVRGLLSDYGAQACALNCIPLVEKLAGTPCLALVRLNDEGFPAACEGDLTALMTMIFLERLADHPTFMGNIVRANPREHLIDINHCVLPLRMAGYQGPEKPYVLRDYHGRGFGVTAAWDPGVGQEVTIARFDPSFRQVLYVKGELAGHGEDYCRSNLRVKIPDVGRFMARITGNHHILVYGDYTKRIEALCEAFGILPVSAG